MNVLMAVIAPIWFCLMTWISITALLIGVNTDRSEPVIAFGVMVAILNTTMLVRNIWREGK